MRSYGGKGKTKGKGGGGRGAACALRNRRGTGLGHARMAEEGPSQLGRPTGQRRREASTTAALPQLDARRRARR